MIFEYVSIGLAIFSVVLYFVGRQQGKRYLQDDDKFPWEILKSNGDDYRRGKKRNSGSCPCEDDFTLSSDVFYFDHMPSDKEEQESIAKLPPPGRPDYNCTSPCDWIVVDEWKGWSILRHKHKKNLFAVAVWWYRQWHCEERPPSGLM